jgi:hypothetical protein
MTPIILISCLAAERGKASMALVTKVSLLNQLYNNDLDQLLRFTSMPTSLLQSQLKHSRFLSLLIRLSVYQTQVSLLGILITFVNIFHFNLLVMFACFTFVSLVKN